jgi:hypothetical protein
LARFETRIGFIDNVETAFATDDLAVAVTVSQGFQRTTDFHLSDFPISVINRIGGWVYLERGI